MRKSLIFLLLPCFLLILAGGVLLAQDDSLGNVGELRVINALVDYGPADVYVNGQKISSALPPGEATAFLSLSPGQYSIAVFPVGASVLLSPIADVLINLPPSQSKSAIAYQTRFGTPQGLIERQNTVLDTAQIGAFIVLDDNRSPLPLGRSRLTAVHLAQGNPGKLSIAYPSRASLLHEIGLKQLYGDIDIDAGVYPLTIVDADSPNLDRLAFIGDQVFQSNVYYTLILVPVTAQVEGQDQPVLTDRPSLLVIDAPVTPPNDGIQLRLIHTAHDTDVVDLYIDGRLVAPRFTYGDYTPYIGLPRYSHLVELRRREAAADSEPLATVEFSITEENQDQQYWSLLLLNGTNVDVVALELLQAQDPLQLGGSEVALDVFETPGGLMSLVLLPDNIGQTQSGLARVRVIHAIDGALEISLFAEDVPRLVGPTPTPLPNNATPEPVRLVPPVFYGIEANESEILAGLYDSLDFIAGNSTEILRLNNYEFLPGMVHTFVLIGLPSGEPAIEALEFTDFGRGAPSQRFYIGTINTAQDVPARLRAGPSTAAGIVALMDSGSEVEVLGRNGNGTWIKIRYVGSDSAIAREAWISQPLVQITRLGEDVSIMSLPERE